MTLANHCAIPAIYEDREFVDVGGLMSYELYRQLNVYTGRVLGLNFAREALLDCRRGRGQRAPWSPQGGALGSLECAAARIHSCWDVPHQRSEASEAKQLMLNVPADYEKLAKRAEDRSTGVKLPWSRG